MLPWRSLVYRPFTLLPKSPSAHSQPHKMSTFTLLGSAPVTVHSLPEVSKVQLHSFTAFRNWLLTLQHSLALQANPSHEFHNSPFKLRSITIQSVDFFGGKRIGFLKLKAEVTNDNGEYLPGTVFLRGQSVCVLLILQPNDPINDDELYAVLTVQPRIAAGSLNFVELPAGMLDDDGSFAGAAAKEIREETGLELSEDDLLNMTGLAAGAPIKKREVLRPAVYPSPGACDVSISLLYAQKSMDRADIEKLKGKLTGLREHGEKITLKICRLDELWSVGFRDGKTLAAIALYQEFRRQGKIC
jgi:ADP-sugar diphosphatase